MQVHDATRSKTTAVGAIQKNYFANPYFAADVLFLVFVMVYKKQLVI
jgi:hypothetical protein